MMLQQTGMSKTIEIAGRRIGQNDSPYLIAEMSGNHNGDIGRAFALIEAAQAAGADAVKLQTYRADTITIDHRSEDFTIRGGLWDGRTLYDLYSEAHTPWEWHERLFEHARRCSIEIFSSPFDPTAVDFLVSLGAPAFKIASFELIDIPLVRKVARAGKPMILSTGMASEAEIAEAVNAVREEGVDDFVLLHCVSGYPTPISEVNLRTLPDLGQRYGALAGLSDHTTGVAVPIAAVAMGAVVIEKHMTLRRADGGPDSAFSLEPDEFALMARSCREAWDCLGSVNYERSESESDNAQFRRSLYIVADVSAGEAFTEKNVRSIRPGYGLPPRELPMVLGRRAAKNIPRGTPLAPELIT